MAGNLRLGGLISGISTDDIIKKILNVESFRIDAKKVQRAALAEKQAAWRTVKSSLNSLRTALDGVRLASSFRTRSASASDAAVATATASTGATVTTHSLTVTSLAQTHVVGTANAATANTALVAPADAGTLTINGKAISVADTDTLNSLRDDINATAGIGVTAEVIKVQVGGVDKYRLVLTSTAQGSAGAMTISDSNGGLLTTALGLDKDGNGNFVNEISVAQDAAFTLDGINYTRSSNTVSDIIPKLTIALKTAGSTSLAVNQDTDSVAQTVHKFVDAVNSTMTMLAEQTKYDSATKAQGPLNGDYLARRLQNSIRSMISNVVPGLPATMNQLSHVGVTTGRYGTADYGKLLLDESTLKAALEADADGVARVFGALRTNVALASNGATVVASSTQAGAYAAADVINGDSSSDRFGFAGGGWESANAPSAGAPETLTLTLSATTVIDQIELSQPSNGTYNPSATGLKDYVLEYLGQDNAWHEITSVTNHSGSYKRFDFTAVEASAVRLSVTGTYGVGNPARVSEFRVNQVNNGVGVDMYALVNDAVTYSTGPIDTRDSIYDDQIKDVDDQISKMNDQMTRREETLRQTFQRMEKALSQLNASGNALMGQLTSLQNATSTRR